MQRIMTCNNLKQNLSEAQVRAGKVGEGRAWRDCPYPEKQVNDGGHYRDGGKNSLDIKSLSGINHSGNSGEGQDAVIQERRTRMGTKAGTISMERWKAGIREGLLRSGIK